MKISHIVWHKAPYTEKELVEIDCVLWKINMTSHGDCETRVVSVLGYFAFTGMGKKFKFVSMGLDGGTTFDIEAFRAMEYGIIID